MRMNSRSWYPINLRTSQRFGWFGLINPTYSHYKDCRTRRQNKEHQRQLPSTPPLRTPLMWLDPTSLGRMKLRMALLGLVVRRSLTFDRTLVNIPMAELRVVRYHAQIYGIVGVRSLPSDHVLVSLRVWKTVRTHLRTQSFARGSRNIFSSQARCRVAPELPVFEGPPLRSWFPALWKKSLRCYLQGYFHDKGCQAPGCRHRPTQTGTDNSRPHKVWRRVGTGGPLFRRPLSEMHLIQALCNAISSHTRGNMREHGEELDGVVGANQGGRGIVLARGAMREQSETFETGRFFLDPDEAGRRFWRALAWRFPGAELEHPRRQVWRQETVRVRGGRRPPSGFAANVDRDGRTTWATDEFHPLRLCSRDCKILIVACWAEEVPYGVRSLLAHVRRTKVHDRERLRNFENSHRPPHWPAWRLRHPSCRILLRVFLQGPHVDFSGTKRAGIPDHSELLVQLVWGVGLQCEVCGRLVGSSPWCGGCDRDALPAGFFSPWPSRLSCQQVVDDRSHWSLIGRVPPRNHLCVCWLAVGSLREALCSRSLSTRSKNSQGWVHRWMNRPTSCRQGQVTRFAKCTSLPWLALTAHSTDGLLLGTS